MAGSVEFVALVAAVVGLGALRLEAASSARAQLRLKIAVNDVYGKATACECVHQIAAREYPEFLERLRQDQGIDLEFVYFSEPYDLVKAVREKAFDGALCKPWLLLRDAAGRGATFERVADLRSPLGDASLWGDVVVLRDSPVRTLRDIGGRRVALGDVDGYEKHHAVLALFQRNQVEIAPAQRFERASCLECLDLLLKRDVDVAVISNYALTADCPADIIKPSDVRVIAHTETIPLTSLMLDPARVPPAERARVGRAVIAVSRTLPASMHGGGFIAPAPWTPQRIAERSDN